MGAAASAGAAANGTVAAGGLAVAGANATAAAIITGLVSFLAALREMNRRFLTRELGGYSKDTNHIAAAVATEQQLEEVFAQRSADRVARALPQVLAIADPAKREAAVRQILADEERFARQRSEAMVARAISAVGRYQVRAESPLGAFWKLGHAQQHTEGCKFLSGKFWPWAVLDRVFPPRHYGCTSSLHGFGDAIANGWMTAADVPDTAQAIRSAIGVVMEQDVGDALLRELAVRDRLMDAGVHESDLQAIEFAGVR